jgi:hypothetical protein
LVPFADAILQALALRYLPVDDLIPDTTLFSTSQYFVIDFRRGPVTGNAGAAERGPCG